MKKFDEDQREKLKISVKVFLTQWRAELAKKAVTKGERFVKRSFIVSSFVIPISFLCFCHIMMELVPSVSQTVMCNDSII